MADHAMTAEGVQALRDEIEQLSTESRREIAERIKVAREWGDLKENSEYHDAKNDQALLERRISTLEERLRNAVVVESNGDCDTVGMGSIIEVTDETSGKQLSYQLVNSRDGSPAQGRLSIESPVARALVGKRIGDTAVVRTPAGERRFHIDSIRTA
jgi:transcription elongation factor GreA